MRSIYAVLLCSSLLGLGLAPSTVLAQAKTSKTCQAEWQANKADFKAKGVSQKAYVAQCLGGAGPTAAAAPSAAKPAPAAAAPAAAQTAAPAAKSAAKPAAAATGNPTGANQFASEGQAKARCPADTVVWLNADTKIYHFAGNRSYGKTKSGAYMCEKDATGQGFRASKTEKHPA